ncbi:hypothetical protein N9L68_08220, partial [bacterium]|nr:hypothetical protein [bacterium]
MCRQCGACWVTPVGTEPPQPSTRDEEPATGDETDLGQDSSSDPEAQEAPGMGHPGQVRTDLGRASLVM